MGVDKAGLIVDGETLASRTARILSEICSQVTFLGPPVAGFASQEDAIPFDGPLSALSRFRPQAELVMVVSCDLPWFESTIVHALSSAISSHDAAVPIQEGRLQPICALYRSSAFPLAIEAYATGGRSMMAWLDRLRIVEVPWEGSEVRGVNTPDEWKRVEARSLPPST